MPANMKRIIDLANMGRKPDLSKCTLDQLQHIEYVAAKMVQNWREIGLEAQARKDTILYDLNQFEKWQEQYAIEEKD